MKKKEKKRIVILLVIMVIAIVIFTFMKKGTGEKKNLEPENIILQQNEKYVEKLEDGTKLNISNKLKETKKIEGLEISDIQLTEKNNVTQVLGTVKNITNTPQGGFVVGVTIFNQEGKEIITIDGYIEQIEPNREVQFSTNGTFEYADAYDIRIIRK